MGERPLRQYYDGVTVMVSDDLGEFVQPWVRHRRRFSDALTGLSEDQWKATTRCTSWDARGVVSHLVTVDSFWTMSFLAARAGTAPTTYIRGFDPSTGTDALVAPLLDLPVDTLLERFLAGTETLIGAVDDLEGDDWSALGEAPFGHMPARLILAHALWDSWLHERDILEPLGVGAAVEEDELLVATWYTLAFGGLQGGLMGDDAPVGPGAEAPIDVALCFDDLPGSPLRVQIDTGARISRVDPGNAVTAGAAVDLVECVTGRAPIGAMPPLPSDLAAQLARAAQIL